MTRDFNFDGNFDGSDIGLKRDDQRISRLVEITPIYKFAYNNNTTTIRKIRVSIHIYIYSIEKIQLTEGGAIVAIKGNQIKQNTRARMDCRV